MAEPDIDLHATEGRVGAPDGTPIAWFRIDPPGDGGPVPADPTSTGRPPLLLVHGTTADHTTFRVFGPRMAATRPVIAIDRRGRGGSGDTLPYAIEREYEDVAAVAEALARAAGDAVDAFGHSYGGRAVMGAATLTRRIRRIVAYEGAIAPGVGERHPGLLERLETLLADGRRQDLLETFLLDAVELTPDEWAAFQASPAFAARVAAAHTVARELRAGSTPEAALGRYTRVEQPVLQVLGSESPAFFRAGAEALAARLPHGRLETIAGARHAAHHTHVDALVILTGGYLDAPEEVILRGWISPSSAGSSSA
jgi:pimeloyl-ACP methyl ester carboxylesterase